MRDDRTPILVGAGQLTQRDAEPASALDPLAMMTLAARRAADDAGAGPALLERLDALAVVNVFCWPYRNLPGALAERIGAHPTDAIYTTVGGNSPQWLVNETAQKIADGRVQLALLAGAEAVRTVLRAQRTNTTLDWTTAPDGKATVVGDRREGTTAVETNHGLNMPTQVYPLFENALRAKQGLSIEAHRAALGTLCSRMSAVAAENPYAWFRDARTAAEIATISADNRLIGFPYPKRMNAIIDVDQGAAVLMTSVAQARALGIPESRWVYLWGTGEATDRWFVSDRVDYVSSPAIREAGRQALGAAAIGIDAVDHLELYSCFPCAVQIGRDMLGVSADDPRPLTVTGGLPYFGGPGNNYSMHGIASMMDRLRAQPGSVGLVTALGWYLTKHAVGIYASRPKDGPFVRPDPTAGQERIDGALSPALATEPSGPATIETYTVLHGRAGEPIRGIVVGRLDDGRRFLANTPDDPSVLERLTTHEGVGVRGLVTPGETNRFDPS
ncbi:MAG TPA: acetyl-CoA acetyltransferase [Candidatus Binatia bacterium]|jgi:acetyl-CoA C-acetyltransferase|nr:acetyl-CoA acetyltransferase [Candidatus Binatia bacterium]